MEEGKNQADKLNAVLVSFTTDVSRTSDLVTNHQQHMEDLNLYAAQIAALIRNMTTQEVVSLQASLGRLAHAVDITSQKGEQVQALMSTMVDTAEYHSAQLDMGNRKLEHHNALLDASAQKIQEIADLATMFSDVASSFASTLEFASVFIAAVSCLALSKWLLGERITCWFAAGVGMTIALMRSLPATVPHIKLPWKLLLAAGFVTTGSAFAVSYRIRKNRHHNISHIRQRYLPSAPQLSQRQAVPRWTV
jgi:hypothetical protein